MDLVLLILLAFAFIGLMSIFHVSIGWAVVLILMLALIYIAIKHPHGRRDWVDDVRSSVYFVVTTVLLISMLYVMYLAAGAIMFPPLVTTLMMVTFTIIVLLIILGIFFPHGWKDAGRG